MHAATMRPSAVRAALPLLLLCALTACGDPATLVAPPPTEPAAVKAGGVGKEVAPSARVLVAGLEGAFGSTIGPDGALYVAEAAAGRIARVDPRTGVVTTFASGLPVNQGTGVQDVAFIGHIAYALVSFVTPEAFGGSGVDGIYRVDGPESFTIVADIGAFNRANPPEPD